MDTDLPALQLHALRQEQLRRALAWCTPERALSELARLQHRHARPPRHQRGGRAPPAWTWFHRDQGKLPN